MGNLMYHETQIPAAYRQDISKAVDSTIEPRMEHRKLV